MGECVIVPRELVEKYPDAEPLEVVGSCCEPDICAGRIVVLSRMERPTPGAFFAAEAGGELPTLGRVNHVSGEFIVGEWNQGGVRYATTSDLIGVVVAVL